MSSDPLRVNKASSPALRTWGPWAAWAAAVGIAVAVNFLGSDLGTAPAVVETKSVALASVAPWRLASVDVSTGDAVTAGQVVAKLDPTQVDARLQVARALLATAEAKVTAKEVELLVGSARVADQQSTEAERAAVALAQLEAEEKRDRAKLQALDEQIAREARLVEGQLSSLGVLNELKLARAALAQTVETYAQTIKRAKERQGGASKRSGEWRGGSEAQSKLQAQLGPAKAEVARARDEVAVLERQRESLDLKAPFAGRIGTIFLRPGETVRTDTPVLVVVDDRPKTVVAWVDQAWAGAVQLGDEVDLKVIDRDGRSFKGKVVGLGPNLVETPLRFRAVPTKVTYSREAHVEIQGEVAVLPGQALKADFRRGSLLPPKNAVGAR